MIKIIEHGNRHFETRCPKCNCRFEYDVDDIFLPTLSLDGTIMSTLTIVREYGTVICPECGQQIQVTYTLSTYPIFPTYPSSPYSPYSPFTCKGETQNINNANIEFTNCKLK